MVGFKSAKELVRDYYSQIDSDPLKACKYCLSVWRGYHLLTKFITQRRLQRRSGFQLYSLTKMQRRMDLIMAGENKLDAGGLWVASMGHLMGLFDNEWLGIPPTRKIAMLRYAEFIRIDDGKITDTAMFFDIPALMMQAGLQPFPVQTGAQLIQPCPNYDGLMFSDIDPEEGAKILKAIEIMIDDITIGKVDVIRFSLNYPYQMTI